MKKIVTVIIALSILISALFFGACYGKEATPQNRKQSSFVEVSYEDCGYGSSITVVYHKDTKVMYAIITHKNGSSGGVTMTILVDAEGKPLLWEENNE